MLHFILAAALLTQSPQQFDLVCTGTMTTSTHMTPAETKPYSGRIRVDLESNRFCEGECASPRTIESVSPAEIVFQTENAPDSQHQYSVNRTTGALNRSIRIGPGAGRINLRTAAQCTRADFSGMPTAAF